MKQIITPLLLTASLLHAAPSTNHGSIFDQLVPSPAQSQLSAQQLPEHYSSRSAIPADVDLCLTLTQPSASIKSLQEYIPMLVTAHGFAQQVENISFALAKDSIATSSDLLFHIHLISAYTAEMERVSSSTQCTLQSIGESENSVPEPFRDTIKKNQDYCEHIHKKVETLKSQLSNLKLPDIYLSASVKPELIYQLQSLIPAMESMIQPDREIPLGEGCSIKDITMTRIGADIKITASIMIYGDEKPYTLYVHVGDQSIHLVGSPDEQTAMHKLAAADSLLAKPDAPRMPAQSDVQLLVQNRDILKIIITKLTDKSFNLHNIYYSYDHSSEECATEMEKTKKEYALIMSELPHVLPTLEDGLCANITLSENPQLELTWKDTRYQFSPSPSKASALISDETEFYFESSQVNIATIATLLKNLTKLGDKQDKIAAALISTAMTGQSVLAGVGGVDYLYLGIHDRAAAQQGLEILAQMEASYEQNEDGKYVAVEKPAGTLPKNTTLTDTHITMCNEPAFLQRVTEAPAGASQSGALFYGILYEDDLPPFETVYGRLTNEGQENTIKIQLRR